MGTGLLSQNDGFSLFSIVSDITLPFGWLSVPGKLSEVIENRVPKAQLLSGRHPTTVPCL